MYCACTTWTVFGVASTGDVLILIMLVLCLYPLYSVLAWPARAMYLLARVCTRTVLVPLYSVYCACTVAPWVLCLYPLYSDSAWLARAMCLFCPCSYLYCGCTIAQCVLCLYLLYNVLAWPARVMYRFSRVCTRTVLVPLHSVYCACTPCTVVRHGSMGNVPILPVFVLVLCLYHFTVCTVLVPLVRCSGMANTGNVPIIPVFVPVLCEYHCRVCTVRVPVVQGFSMGSTGNVPIFPVFVLVLCVYHCTVRTVLVPLVHVCMCIFFPFILDIKFVGRTSRGHTGGRSHRIFHPPSFCVVCLSFPTFPSSTVKLNFVY